jgi:hypothetical protein
MNKKIDWHQLGAKTIINGFGGYGLYISYGHITHMLVELNARPSQAAGAPAFVDGIMVLGRIMTSQRWCDRTNRRGHRMIIGGAIASLAANISAGILGHSIGDVIIGVLVVGGYLICEAAAGAIRSRAAVAKAKADADAAAAKAAAIAQGVATRKANAAAKQTAPTPKTAPKARKPRTAKPATPATSVNADALVGQLEKVTEVAPVSPAPWLQGHQLIVARTMDEATR